MVDVFLSSSSEVAVVSMAISTRSLQKTLSGVSVCSLCGATADLQYNMGCVERRVEGGATTSAQPSLSSVGSSCAAFDALARNMYRSKPTCDVCAVFPTYIALSPFLSPGASLLRHRPAVVGALPPLVSTQVCTCLLALTVTEEVLAKFLRLFSAVLLTARFVRGFVLCHGPVYTEGALDRTRYR